MNETNHASEDIALELIEEALFLFMEKGAYFAAITLAGAAEEILGKLAKHQGKENSLDSLKRASCRLYEGLFGEPIPASEFATLANYAKNKLKHVNPGTEPTVTLDAKEEAGSMLVRAIDNYWLVKESLTPTMERFEREWRVE